MNIPYLIQYTNIFQQYRKINNKFQSLNIQKIDLLKYLNNNISYIQYTEQLDCTLIKNLLNNHFNKTFILKEELLDNKIHTQTNAKPILIAIYNLNQILKIFYGLFSFNLITQNYFNTYLKDIQNIFKQNIISYLFELPETYLLLINQNYFTNNILKNRLLQYLQLTK